MPLTAGEDDVGAGVGDAVADFVGAGDGVGDFAGLATGVGVVDGLDAEEGDVLGTGAGDFFEPGVGVIVGAGVDGVDVVGAVGDADPATTIGVGVAVTAATELPCGLDTPAPLPPVHPLETSVARANSARIARRLEIKSTHASIRVTEDARICNA